MKTLTFNLSWSLFQQLSTWPLSSASLSLPQSIPHKTTKLSFKNQVSYTPRHFWVPFSLSNTAWTFKSSNQSFPACTQPIFFPSANQSNCSFKTELLRSPWKCLELLGIGSLSMSWKSPFSNPVSANWTLSLIEDIISMLFWPSGFHDPLSIQAVFHSQGKCWPEAHALIVAYNEVTVALHVHVCTCVCVHVFRCLSPDFKDYMPHIFVPFLLHLNVLGQSNYQ